MYPIKCEQCGFRGVAAKENRCPMCKTEVAKSTESPASSGLPDFTGCNASEIEAQKILVAAAVAHRACCGTEHDPENGKLHGYCVVCGVAWPCETAKKFM